MAGKTDSPRALRQFGSRLRAERQEQGWTLEQLGERSGLHWTYVGSVERGQRNISLTNILRLASALGIDADDLVAGLRP